jgi:hypothetical protein
MRLAILFWEEENGPSVLKGLFAMDQEKALDTILEREKLRERVCYFH